MHSFVDHPLSLSGATPFMIKRETDWISIALFGSVYVAIKACIEPLPDDGEIDTGITLCACTAAKAFNPINRAATKRLSLKAVRECVRSRGSRGGRRSASNTTSFSFIQTSDSFSGNGSLSCLVPLFRYVSISI